MLARIIGIINIAPAHNMVFKNSKQLDLDSDVQLEQ